MLLFDVYRDGVPAEHIELSGSYLFGQDSVPIRADITAAGNQITCAKRTAGAAGLMLLWPAGPSGTLLLPTTRLQERAKPYILNLELARARMMLIAKKREDWGLLDFSTAEKLSAEFDEVRKIFIEALKAEQDDPVAASKLGDTCLTRGIFLSEKMALFHASIFIARRRRSNNFVRSGLGCMVDLPSQSDPYRERLREVFDFVTLPTVWKDTQPQEGNIQFQPLDTWSDWAIQNKMPIHAGPLVSFNPKFYPDWMFIWEHDYETLRDMTYEYVQRIVTRYVKRVRSWTVVSGLHACNTFNLSFEQIMELTRLTCGLVKKLSPRSNVMIDLIMPWGDYYARNVKTIPPMLYADACVQGGVKFDSFGLQLYMGVAEDGYFVRDLMQVSDMLDSFASFGKMLHVSACEAPSDFHSDPADAWGGGAHSQIAGCWRRPWDEPNQADWLEALYCLALSRPYIESVCWRDLADYDGHFLPHGGLCHPDLSPKPSYERIRHVRSLLTPPSKPVRPAPQSGGGNAK